MVNPTQQLDGSALLPSTAFAPVELEVLASEQCGRLRYNNSPILLHGRELSFRGLKLVHSLPEVPLVGISLVLSGAVPKEQLVSAYYRVTQVHWGNVSHHSRRPLDDPEERCRMRELLSSVVLHYSALRSRPADSRSNGELRFIVTNWVTR